MISTDEMSTQSAQGMGICRYIAFVNGWESSQRGVRSGGRRRIFKRVFAGFGATG